MVNLITNQYSLFILKNKVIETREEGCYDSPYFRVWVDEIVFEFRFDAIIIIKLSISWNSRKS